MYSLNETIKLLTDVADGHDQIAMSGVGDLAEWNPTERNYPLLWIVPVDTETEKGRLGRTFRVGCFDRVIKGEDGQDNQYHEQEVLSDMEMVLLDFVAYFVQQDQEGFFTTRVANLTPATEQMDDRLAGYFVELTILHDWDFNKCQIPATIGSPASGVDGLTLYDFCDTSVFNRLTQAQKDCLTTTLCGVCDDATVKSSSGLPLYTETVASGGELILPKGKVRQSDGVTDVLVEYTPNADGYIFQADTCGTAIIPATITGGVDIGYGEAITIGCSESGYDSYEWIFCARDFPDTHIDAMGQNPSPILNWDGIWDVRLIVTQGSSVGYATTTVTVNGGLRYHELGYIPNTGGGFVGTDSLYSLNSSFYWGANNNFVLLSEPNQLIGDGGCIFQIGIGTLRMVAFTTVQDDPTTGFEYNNAATKWGLYWSFEDRMRLKDNASFPDVLTTDLKDMKWYKIQRVAGDFKFYEGDSPDSDTWTELYDYSIDDVADMYLVVYLHQGSFRSYSNLYKFGNYA